MASRLFWSGWGMFNGNHQQNRKARRNPSARRRSLRLEPLEERTLMAVTNSLLSGAGQTGGPHVRGISAADGSDTASFLAYVPGFTGGVRVAGGDLSGDGVPDVYVLGIVGNSVENLLNALLVADQDALDVGVERGACHSLNDDVGSKIAAHGVDRNRRHVNLRRLGP